MSDTTPPEKPRKNLPDAPNDEVILSAGESVSFEVPENSRPQHITVNIAGGAGNSDRPRSPLGCVWSVFQGCGCLVVVFVVIALVGSLFR
ncbi:MAG: hypothetical protein ACOYNK_02830 [Microbacteriaceae bacterium]